MHAEKPLAPYAEIGDNLCISYDQKTAMTCSARVEIGQDQFGNTCKYIVVSGESRKPDAWLGVELTVPSQTDHVTFRMRMYPEQNITPFIYIDRGGETETISLPQQPTNDAFFALRIGSEHWAQNIKQPYDALRIGLMTKTSNWYAIGLMSVDIKENADA
jgi:hypothetical protein